MTARNEHLPGRDAPGIINDFSAAASRIARIGDDWMCGLFRAGDLADANAAVEGLRALLIELRQEVAR